jgi:diguanylate cyclase (GGDEF)-like protein
MVDRLRLENRVLTEMAALASSDQEYEDVVQTVLDLIEDVVSSPLLTLSVREIDQVRHYNRSASDIDPLWSGEAAAFGAEVSRKHLSRSFSLTPARHEHHLASPPVWVTLFAGCTRSGGASALALAAGELPAITKDEEQLMLRLVRQIALVVDHALLSKQVEDLEATDRLTGVTSQRRLLEILEYEMPRHRHTGHRLSVMMIDVEGLDRINRSYGRQYGNHILQRLAGMLKDVVRPIDIVARCGLDEFTVLLPESDGDDAERLAERVRERIETAEFAGGTVGLSTGVAHARPDETLSADGLLRRAENALAASKRQDRTLSALVSRQRRVR